MQFRDILLNLEKYYINLTYDQSLIISYTYPQ